MSAATRKKSSRKARKERATVREMDDAITRRRTKALVYAARKSETSKTHALSLESQSARVLDALASPFDLLFEIGVEELPTSYIEPALRQLERSTRVGLDELRLSPADVMSWATPRRLTVYVHTLARRQADLVEEAIGPAARVAFDADGKPTRALLGFCKGKGADPESVRRVETPRGEYVAVTVHHVGRPAAEVMPSFLAALATRLQFPKSMRWLSDSDIRFARPVRWLLALLGNEVVPVRAFGLEAGRITYGHRFLNPSPIQLRTASDYQEALRRAKVIVDQHERIRHIEGQLENLAAKAGGTALKDEELIKINAFLTELPTAFFASIPDAAKYSELPREVQQAALREHQRCFALTGGNGLPDDWLTGFLAVRNGDENGLESVRKGNRDVVEARLADALFYWETDLKKPQSALIEALANVVWMEGLGSLKEKSERLQGLSGWLAERLAPGTVETVTRASLLCKTDLLSEMIGSGKEYAGLQGIIGGYYAQKAGEPSGVPEAIYWHYHPRFSEDELPRTVEAAVLALADKIDHVVGAFVAGKPPAGSEDPYGVRRAATGVIRILCSRQWHLSIRASMTTATAPFFAANPELPQAAAFKQLGEFWKFRVSGVIGGGEEGDESFDPWMVDAAMYAAFEGRQGWDDPYDCLARTRLMHSFRDDPRFTALVILFRRVGNILKAEDEELPPTVDRKLLTDEREQALAVALERAQRLTQPLWEKRAYDGIPPVLLDMERAIHEFFDGVLVNVEDAPTRLNRLRLLADVHALFMRGWDLSRVVEGEKR